MVNSPLVAGDVSVVLFAGIGIEGKELIQRRLAGAEHVAALAKHPHEQKQQEETLEDNQKCVVLGLMPWFLHIEPQDIETQPDRSGHQDAVFGEDPQQGHQQENDQRSCVYDAHPQRVVVEAQEADERGSDKDANRDDGLENVDFGILFGALIDGLVEGVDEVNEDHCFEKVE